LSFEVFPFSYAEYLTFTGKDRGADSLRAYLDDGGFPAFLSERRDLVLQALLRDVVQRDVAARHGLRETRHVMNLLLFLLTPNGVLGVDFGIVNIATDRLGNQHSGARVEAYRERYAKRRATLQRVGTKAAKRRLKTMSGKQRRFQKHENHRISKRIVATAERAGLSIGLEDLKGIREQVKASKAQRKRLHNWSFGQLRAFVESKATRAGVPVVAIDPRSTSKECSVCGYIDSATGKASPSSGAKPADTKHMQT